MLRSNINNSLQASPLVLNMFPGGNDAGEVAVIRTAAVISKVTSSKWSSFKWVSFSIGAFKALIYVPLTGISIVKYRKPFTEPSIGGRTSFNDVMQPDIFLIVRFNFLSWRNFWTPVIADPGLVSKCFGSS